MAVPVLAASLVGSASAASPEWATFGEPGRVSDRTIDVVATDTHYRPDLVHVRRGETIRFVVTDRGNTAHEFVIGDAAFEARHQREMEQMPDMKMDDPNEVAMEPGQAGSLTWRFTRKGDFLFACDYPGHARAGMVGHIVVR